MVDMVDHREEVLVVERREPWVSDCSLLKDMIPEEQMTIQTLSELFHACSFQETSY